MSGGKLRIVAGPPIEAALAATGNEFPSGRLNAIAARYLAMIEASRPPLSRDEWLSLFDALGDSVGLIEEYDFDRDGWGRIVAEIADAPWRTGRGGTDMSALAHKIHALSEPARIAIIETAQRFWALAHLSGSRALDLATSHPATWPDQPADG